MSGRFTSDDLRRVAELARLALTADEEALFARQLDAFLIYADQVQQLDTREVPPLSHPGGDTGSLRADEPAPSLPREAALAAAPDADRTAGLFKVPRVIG